MINNIEIIELNYPHFFVNWFVILECQCNHPTGHLLPINWQTCKLRLWGFSLLRNPWTCDSSCSSSSSSRSLLLIVGHDLDVWKQQLRVSKYSTLSKHQTETYQIRGPQSTCGTGRKCIDGCPWLHLGRHAQDPCLLPCTLYPNCIHQVACEQISSHNQSHSTLVDSAPGLPPFLVNPLCSMFDSMYENPPIPGGHMTCLITHPQVSLKWQQPSW